MSYVSSAPLSFLGRSSVGTGECVPLVQAATTAPLTVFWKRGAPVQGNTTLKPGTAIATFDANGRYGNHTNGASHAAIYLGQDARGIEVIDQWNIRQHHQIIGKHAPQKRVLRFQNPHAQPVDQGSQYYVVE